MALRPLTGALLAVALVAALAFLTPACTGEPQTDEPAAAAATASAETRPSSDSAATNSTAAPKQKLPFTGETLIAYIALGLMAMVPIYVGAVRSIEMIGPGGVTKDDAGETRQTGDAMSRKDAYMFPVFGSAVLFSLYLAFKFLAKEYINFVFLFYFGLLGTFAVAECFAVPALLAVLPGAGSLNKDQRTLSLNLRFWNSAAEPSKLDFTMLQVVAVLAAIPVIGWYAATKHWIANNIIALAFSVEGIRMMSLGRYSTGALLLSLLFFYDVFWVFGTDVMVTVATSFDAPIKVVFPRLILSAPDDPLKRAMLGLGDIVLPGVFLALLRRFDALRSGGRSALYFNIAYAAYFGGLVTTIVVMTVFEAAQPALLYLVPAVLVSSSLTGLARGEMGALLEYSEGGEEEAATAAGE